ncbi:MAG: hypothetical protein ABEJ28_00655 [Salinigranum sp.]
MGEQKSSSLARVDAHISELLSRETPLERAGYAIVDARAEREPARLVLEVSGGAGSGVARYAIPAATAIDLLHARTTVRWGDFPTRGTVLDGVSEDMLLLIGDYLQALAFQVMVKAGSGVSHRSLVRTLTRGTVRLCEREQEAASSQSDGIPPDVFANLLDLARDLGDLIAAQRDDTGRG